MGSRYVNGTMKHDGVCLLPPPSHHYRMVASQNHQSKCYFCLQIWQRCIFAYNSQWILQPAQILENFGIHFYFILPTFIPILNLQNLFNLRWNTSCRLYVLPVVLMQGNTVIKVDIDNYPIKAGIITREAWNVDRLLVRMNNLYCSLSAVAKMCRSSLKHNRFCGDTFNLLVNFIE